MLISAPCRSCNPKRAPAGVTGAVATGVGRELANRLGLRLPKREGHDLAGPCISCKSSDAFRLHQDSGVAHCYSCQASWSPFQVAELILSDREQAKRLLVELGIFQPKASAGCGAGVSPAGVQPGRLHHKADHKECGDPLEIIARQKRITRQSLVAYGARGCTASSIRLPAYGPDGEECTTFLMSTDGGKGLFEKGKKAGLFFPHFEGSVRLPGEGQVWHLVEGPKDAAALHGLGLLACGMNTRSLAAKFARLFAGADVVLIPDRDRAGEEGSLSTARVLWRVARSVRIAVLPAEFQETHGQDVRDILQRPEGEDRVLKAIADARVWEPDADAEAIPDARPEIEVRPEEHEVNDQAIRALAGDTTLYQRAGALVHILCDASGRTLRGVSRAAHCPRIVPLREASLRERLSAAARFVKRIWCEEGERLVQVHPPMFCISAVAARGHWPGIRDLQAVINSPILRPDGTVLQTPGYDEATGLYYHPQDASMDVPAAPTLEQVQAAREALLEVVVDFPFSKPGHQAAWLALVLTPLARYTFSGPSPLFLIDANIRATGKSLLADAASIIITGRPMARMSDPRAEDETRKRITAIAIGGDQMVLIDNIDGELGNAALDAALTSTVWKDRILGRSEIVEVPMLTTWAATGNNVVLRADTSRRVCHIRLESKLEKPEEREDFRHRELLRWVGEERPRLLQAALTILAGYFRAGRPDQHLKAWGSFEGWSGVVRQAMVWSGSPDPGETREELALSSDRDAAGLRALLQGWPEIDPQGQGVTAAQLVRRLEESPSEFELVRGALMELCPAGGGKLPGPKSIGSKLRRLRGRVVGGKFLNKREIHGWACWSVADVSAEVAAR